jgi:hypothetical protein
MMNRIVRLGVFGALLSGWAVSAADPGMCPERISTRQQLAAPVAEWDSWIDDMPQRLASVTFYEGAPEERASLVYDKTAKAGGKQTSTWNFAPQGDRRIWLACSYSGTAVTLKKALPAGTRVCTVTSSLKEQIAGMPAIEKIVCK